MATQTRKGIEPPRIAAVLTALLPASRRNNVSGDWHECDLTPSEYVQRAVRDIPPIVAGEVRRTFDPVFVTGELGVLWLAFGRAELLPLSVMVFVTLGLLILREAYIDPARRSRKEALSHAIAAVLFVVLTQTVLMIAAPSLAMPSHLIAYGAALTGLFMILWRLTFFLMKPSRSGLQSSRPSYDDAVRLNIIWAAACYILLVMSVEAAPQTVRGRDYAIGVISSLILCMAIHPFRMRTLSSSPPVITDFSGVRARQEMVVKRDRLLMTGRNTRLEIAFFIVASIPTFSAFWSWFWSWSAGNPASIRVDWTWVWMNLTALIALCLLWTYVKKRNQDAAELLEQELDAGGRKDI